jgi:hypothetical protein
LKTLDVVDSCDQFELKVAKWKKISKAMMDAKFSHHYKNGHILKDKWTLYWVINPGSKDYTDMISINEDYWVFSTQNMSCLDLPKQCIKEIYVIIESFLSSRPTFCPLLA